MKELLLGNSNLMAPSNNRRTAGDVNTTTEKPWKPKYYVVASCCTSLIFQRSFTISVACKMVCQ
jgi:hypothetical protein